MIIFGAGASYGSRRERHPREPLELGEPQRPPLTNELLLDKFGRFADSYPSSRPAIVALRRALSEYSDKPIEAAISELYQAAAGDRERAMHLLALRFYLCDLVETVSTDWWKHFHGFTHYTELLDRIGTWRRQTGEPVLLVTFNYDTLLDRTAEDQAGDWKLGDFPSYVKRNDWQLYKLHGSVGWSRVLTTTGTFIQANPNEVIAQSQGADFDSGELSPYPWSRAVQGKIGAAVPGIAVPTTLKQNFQCPPEHVSKFTEAVGSIDRLLTIGWRAAEPHVLELLAQNIPPGYHLAICDQHEDDINLIHQNLGFAAERGLGPTAFTGGFTGLLEGGNLEKWLSLPAPGQPLP
jgi:hypothetical protein